MADQPIPEQSSTGKPTQNYLKKFGLIALAIVLIGLWLLSLSNSPKRDATCSTSDHKDHGDCLMHQEAQVALRQIYEAEKVFHARHHRYGNFDEIGFSLPETNNRYTYRIDESGKPGTIIKSSKFSPPRCGRLVPVRANFSNTHFIATAEGFLSSDNYLHAWHINELGQGLEKPDIHGGWPLSEQLVMDCVAERR